MDDLDNQYRNNLEKLEQKAQDDYDKTVLTLSGGALGITIAFINDIIGSDHVINSKYIFCSWILWTISMTAILLSFYTSVNAMRKAIEQVDKRETNNKPAGWDTATGILNIIGGLSFIIGVVFAVIFTYSNL